MFHPLYCSADHLRWHKHLTLLSSPLLNEDFVIFRQRKIRNRNTFALLINSLIIEELRELLPDCVFCNLRFDLDPFQFPCLSALRIVVNIKLIRIENPSLFNSLELSLELLAKVLTSYLIQLLGFAQKYGLTFVHLNDPALNATVKSFALRCQHATVCSAELTTNEPLQLLLNLEMCLAR